MAPELVRFYTDVLERETVEDYFERQAVTMQIIERFVRPGSVEEVRCNDNFAKRITPDQHPEKFVGRHLFSSRNL